MELRTHIKVFSYFLQNNGVSKTSNANISNLPKIIAKAKIAFPVEDTDV